MKPRIFIILFIGLLFLVNNSSSLAQSVCPIEILKIDNVKGRVVGNDGKDQPITLTKVELFEVDNSENLIASTKTDENGYFKIENVKKGEYRLVAWATVEGFILFRYQVIVRVKGRKKKENPKVITVLLGIDCHNSNAKVIREKTKD